MTNGLALQRITEYYGKKSSWPEVGRAVAQDALENGQIHAVTERDVNRYQALSHALYHGRVKHSPTLRRALGIPPETEPVPVCENCGHVHTQHKQCSDERSDTKRTKANGWLRRAVWIHEDDMPLFDALLARHGATSLQELIDNHMIHRRRLDDE